MNPDLQLLQSYPFEKLALLKKNCVPIEKSAINLSIGEPQHAAPDLILKAMTNSLDYGLGKYPSTRGSDALRKSITHWLTQRFKLPVESLSNQQILPVNGTREALFAFTQCVINRQVSKPLVLMPNPFYQIYEGAALLAGATPYYLNCLENTNFQPDFASVPEAVWARCQLLIICSPNNPSGTVLNLPTLQNLINYADKYDFIIAADECYSEIYADEEHPPVGLLQACAALGRLDYQRCIVFHSLSKRSNVPGLRSGFVAGDADIIRQFLLYRTYHGCAMSLAVQSASIAAWDDEEHVKANRQLYREKYDAVMEILAPQVSRPPAGFYLWAKTPIADDEFAQELFLQQNVTVLPGSFLSRTVNGINPGKNRIRIALVAPLDECVEAAQRIRSLINDLID